MKKKILWRFILIGSAVALAAVFFLPNTPLFKNMPDWWQKNMPDKGISLGLDLQGGIHLVFEVEGERAVEITTERIAQSIRDIISKKKINAEVASKGLFITVSPSSMETRKAIEDNYPVLTPVETGTNIVYKISDKEANRIKNNAADQAIETIRNRIDQFGVAEPTIQRQGTNEIVIQLPGIKDPKRAIEIIGKTAQLEFKLVDDASPVAAEIPASIEPGEEENLLKKFAEKLPADDELLFEKRVNRETGAVRKIPILVKKQAALTGDLLKEARVNIDSSRAGYPYVSISFNAAGAKLFDEVTAANVKKRLAIVLDNTIYSAPEIKERIGGGNAQISGSFSMDEAKDLSIVLKAGALPAPVKMLQNITVGPSLGTDSIEAGKMAGILGTLLVVLFMIVYYKLSGVIADFALVLNIILLLGAMASLNATLTMPGIAGIILAIGMAVDSNVLMFERMRDELRSGKTPRAAVDSGYKKAFWTIFDSHVTTLITAAVLFQLGTGPIKGFAVTLSLGVAINLFTALVGTKTVFDLILSRRDIRELSI
ncbi:MAG: protein translocase subunit SecD [Nitrospirae bacterium CG_4_10_14_3_um_filter_44_29]|nr:protein translocase subunit SecD [Nitrospirota bacterium]OIO29323.1 MAG: protein-export membrane protein SecD [Nitrospirae bacterium CG1_02_44_142]PIP70223.1 MAG: protein translocase subunit SecD [Nitrospirae bacterium CG22_combo_CG10-13_8_21_14_all_44_11]PIV40694.1 MAG: protein translocase subunit SecD [Nitrospirae bacterium CG02_land_8_20_14_3_00_44_33]PIV65817.1 MAG: protein translocase subunit SecD [Nitrospirae bacterium CG01_land_8_20_14_3_00_44_22]PIW88808.1 MAG: protein translocase s